MTACNLLNTQIDLPLDIEPILPGENEVASAKRMVERLCNNYTRFFDVIVADALYMEGPFVNFCVGKGKDVIIVGSTPIKLVVFSRFCLQNLDIVPKVVGKQVVSGRKNLPFLRLRI